MLDQAVQLGFADLNLMRRDTDLDSLRDDPRYLALEGELERGGS